MVEEPEVTATGYMRKTSCQYLDCDETSFVFSVQRYDEPAFLELVSTEKDSSSVEHYIANGRLFYIMSNNHLLNAVWSDGQSTVITIAGSISIEILKNILKSIGE